MEIMMEIMLEDKYVFIHIPKTAGTSIRALFVDIFNEDCVSPAFPVTPISDDYANYLNSFKVICGHISMADIDRYFPDRKLITFLRNPIDRCLSVYGYFRQITSFPLIPLDVIRNINDPAEAISLARLLNIDDFFCTTHPHCLQNIQNRMAWQLGYSAKYELRCQLSENDAFDRAMHSFDNISFVGFYENLEKDIIRLCSFLGDNENRPLKKLNTTITPFRSDSISEKAKQAITRINNLDISLYNHILEKQTSNHKI